MTDVERMLREHGGIQQRIKELEQQITEIEAKKEGVYDKLLRGKVPKGDRIRGGPFYDPVVEAVAKLVDVYAERIRKLSADLAAEHGKLAKIEDVVNRAELTETELRYVRLRYFERLPAWKVAQESAYSERAVRRIKISVLQKMAAFGRFFLL